jgi:hypothetical protein
MELKYKLAVRSYDVGKAVIYENVAENVVKIGLHLINHWKRSEGC